MVIVSREFERRLCLSEATAQIMGVLKTLPCREREIITRRYGLGYGHTYTLEEVARLFSGASRILRALADMYPAPLDKQELGERTGMSAGSGTFGTYLSKLRALELIEGRGELRASPNLMG